MRQWRRLEQAYLNRVTKYPLSMTAREQAGKLLIIRAFASGITLCLMGLLGAGGGALAGWAPLVALGAVLYLAGVIAMTLAMAVSVIVEIIFGD